CKFGSKNAVFKFQWIPEGNLESKVHRSVLTKKVPHVPKLLYAAKVTGKQDDKGNTPILGEVLIIEDVGSRVSDLFNSSISDLFKCSSDTDKQVQVIDTFAAYAHTLIAAAKVDEDSQFVLHRDVSLRNLMVKPSGHPYVIDWGYGRICDSDASRRTALGKVIIGTTIYMGIRILDKYKTRSVVDDLESLFLVFCHCIWRTYGNIKNKHYDNLWKCGDMHTVTLTRKDWLGSKITLLKRMDTISGTLPESYQMLIEGMFDLLFPSSSPIGSFEDCHDDPRVKAFKSSEWLSVFERAAEISSPAPYTDALRNEVTADPNRRISFIAEEAASALVESDNVYVDLLSNKDDDSLLDTSTRKRGTKRGSASQLSSTITKISRH
ncbi:hypothetical protein EV175_005230, partial [Coemansia sp. RSA 1933]